MLIHSKVILKLYLDNKLCLINGDNDYRDIIDKYNDIQSYLVIPAQIRHWWISFYVAFEIDGITFFNNFGI